MNLFFKKNLILKTFLFLFLFSLLFFPINFFYNKNKASLAAEEEEEKEVEYEKLKCGREIPVGEAMEKTGRLLEEIIKEFEIIETNSYYLIEKQKEMEELAKKCSLKNCQSAKATCEIRINFLNLPYCFEEAKECLGEPCEKEKIEELFVKITNFNEEIQKAKDEIDRLIYEETESLCAKENEDIGTWWEKFQCKNITIKEAIGRKLDLSRSEFDKCYIPPADWEKVTRGERIVKILWNCDTVMDRDLPRYTKTIEKVDDKEIPVCTSFHNWFCCY